MPVATIALSLVAGYLYWVGVTVLQAYFRALGLAPHLIPVDPPDVIAQQALPLTASSGVIFGAFYRFARPPKGHPAPELVGVAGWILENQLTIIAWMAVLMVLLFASFGFGLLGKLHVDDRVRLLALLFAVGTFVIVSEISDMLRGRRLASQDLFPWLVLTLFSIYFVVTAYPTALRDAAAEAARGGMTPQGTIIPAVDLLRPADGALLASNVQVVDGHGDLLFIRYESGDVQALDVRSVLIRRRTAS